MKTGFDTDEMIRQIKSLLNRHQMDLEQLIKDFNFVYNGVGGLLFKCHRKSLNHASMADPT